MSAAFPEGGRYSHCIVAARVHKYLNDRVGPLNGGYGTRAQTGWPNHRTHWKRLILRIHVLQSVSVRTLRVYVLVGLGRTTATYWTAPRMDSWCPLDTVAGGVLGIQGHPDGPR